MDVLSEVLKAVKLDGAMFYNAEYSAPLVFRAPASGTLPNFGHYCQAQHNRQTDRQGIE